MHTVNGLVDDSLDTAEEMLAHEYRDDLTRDEIARVLQIFRRAADIIAAERPPVGYLLDYADMAGRLWERARYLRRHHVARLCRMCQGRPSAPGGMPCPACEDGGTCRTCSNRSHPHGGPECPACGRL